MHSSWKNFLADAEPTRLLYFSKRATQSYTGALYREDDYLVFGPETRGLPAEMLESNSDRCYRIPMMSTGVRSLNLSNAVSIVLYEALRQLGRT